MREAFSYYLHYRTGFDYFIIGVGGVIFLLILFLALLVPIWSKKDFFRNYKKRKRTLDLLSSATQLLPLLGLLGTVLAMLGTFSGIGASGKQIDPTKVISDFAPALTTTATGIMCLLFNLFFLMPSYFLLDNSYCVNRGDEEQDS
ncbi:MAG: MotA/TolQ/ExbB proton channel family protein [Thermoguttaceae bacterium]|jgi:hypothetical protein